MRILIIDERGNSLDWALRCQADGHDVRWFIRQTPKTDKIGRGLVEIVAEWQGWARWADLILLTDNTRYLHELERWRREGKAIIGPSVEAASWELERTTGMKVFRKAGIATPDYREFSNYDDAIRYVKREERRFVSKPCGDEPDKSLSYVSKSPADMVYMLQRWKAAKRHKGAFILQETVDGCEMAVGGWFGPGGFNAGWLENWEFKRLMPGDMGPNTGEQGTVMRYVRSSKLARQVLAPLAGALEKLGYVGYVDVNTIIDDQGRPWPLEFTMRPGWPTFNIQQALHEGDHAEWLADLARGVDAGAAVLDEVAVGVVMAIPDYPYSHITRKDVCGVPLYGVTPAIADRVHPCEIQAGTAPLDVKGKIVETPTWVSAGDYILVASGTGETVRTARNQVYRVLKRLSMPNSPFYRTDIGAKLKTMLPELQRHDYATNLSY